MQYPGTRKTSLTATLYRSEPLRTDVSTTYIQQQQYYSKKTLQIYKLHI